MRRFPSLLSIFLLGALASSHAQYTDSTSHLSTFGGIMVPYGVYGIGDDFLVYAQGSQHSRSDTIHTYITKLGPDGSEVWTRQFTGSHTVSSRARIFHTTTESTLLLAACDTNIDGVPTTLPTLIKVSHDGAVLWKLPIDSAVDGRFSPQSTDTIYLGIAVVQYEYGITNPGDGGPDYPRLQHYGLTISPSGELLSAVNLKGSYTEQIVDGYAYKISSGWVIPMEDGELRYFDDKGMETSRMNPYSSDTARYDLVYSSVRDDGRMTLILDVFDTKPNRRYVGKIFALISQDGRLQSTTSLNLERTISSSYLQVDMHSQGYSILDHGELMMVELKQSGKIKSTHFLKRLLDHHLFPFQFRRLSDEYLILAVSPNNSSQSLVIVKLSLDGEVLNVIK